MAGSKIKYYRLKKGFTSEQLAKAIGCTKAAISLYESEEREPNAEVYKKIARALNVPWVNLLSTNNSLKFNHAGFRKKQSVSKRDIDLLTIQIENECANRILILECLGESLNRHIKPKKLSFNDDPIVNAQRIRAMLSIPQSGPIYSTTNVLEHAGIIVLSFECAEEIDGLNGTVNNIPYIFFNSKNRTIERQRFTAIHETCHLFFNNSEEGWTEKEIEKYINRVAGNVLMPNDDIYRIFGQTNRNLTVYLRNEIAKEYKIAPSCLINRLFEAGCITEIYHKKFFIFLNKNGGRTKEKTLLDMLKDSETPTIFEQQVYLALSEELITSSKAAELLHTSLYKVNQNMRVE